MKLLKQVHKIVNLLVLLIVLISHMSIQITSVKVEVLQTNWLWSEGLEVSVLNQSGGWSESKKKITLNGVSVR